MKEHVIYSDAIAVDYAKSEGVKLQILQNMGTNSYKLADLCNVQVTISSLSSIGKAVGKYYELCLSAQHVRTKNPIDVKLNLGNFNSDEAAIVRVTEMVTFFAQLALADLEPLLEDLAQTLDINWFREPGSSNLKVTTPFDNGHDILLLRVSSSLNSNTLKFSEWDRSVLNNVDRKHRVLLDQVVGDYLIRGAKYLTSRSNTYGGVYITTTIYLGYENKLSGMSVMVELVYTSTNLEPGVFQKLKAILHPKGL